MKIVRLILASVLIQLAFFFNAAAHPGSGIVVDRYGNVYFVYSGYGVLKISVDGKLSSIHKAADGHWLCLDEAGSFSKFKPTYFERITPEDEVPTIIFAGGGSPIVVNKNGNLYYCGGMNGDQHPGGKTIVQETPQKQQSIFSAHLEDTLNKLDDGITAIATAPDGTLYLACWNSIIKLGTDGKINVILHSVGISDCDEDPADHRAANLGKPLLRGIAVDSGGNIYAAATSCHCLVKIMPNRKLMTILKSERPWTPTGVAFRNGNLYILEYTNANGPATEGWVPRVRKIDGNGKVTVLADLSINAR